MSASKSSATDPAKPSNGELCEWCDNKAYMRIESKFHRARYLLCCQQHRHLAEVAAGKANYEG